MKKLLCIFAFLALGGSCFAEPFRIVAYGDSITYGWIPNPNPPSTRNGPEDRWPGALQKELGTNFQVIEEGLDGENHRRAGSRVVDQRSSTRRERVPSRMPGFTFAGGSGDHHARNKRPQTIGCAKQQQTQSVPQSVPLLL